MPASSLSSPSILVVGPTCWCHVITISVPHRRIHSEFRWFRPHTISKFRDLYMHFECLGSSLWHLKPKLTMYFNILFSFFKVFTLLFSSYTLSDQCYIIHFFRRYNTHIYKHIWKDQYLYKHVNSRWQTWCKTQYPYYWAVQRCHVIGSEKRIDELRKHLMSNVGGWHHH